MSEVERYFIGEPHRPNCPKCGAGVYIEKWTPAGDQPELYFEFDACFACEWSGETRLPGGDDTGNSPESALKRIVVQWIQEEGSIFGKGMRVVESNHERFIAGSRFDFGFFNIATDEGYAIVSLPMQPE